MKILGYTLLAWIALTTSVTVTGVLSGVAALVFILSVSAIITEEE